MATSGGGGRREAISGTSVLDDSGRGPWLCSSLAKAGRCRGNRAEEVRAVAKPDGPGHVLPNPRLPDCVLRGLRERLELQALIWPFSFELDIVE